MLSKIIQCEVNYITISDNDTTGNEYVNKTHINNIVTYIFRYNEFTDITIYENNELYADTKRTGLDVIVLRKGL